jgi:diguanylate cyclase (GGDEF)-like protein
VTEEKTVDVLTGLPNRVLLLDQLECALDRACRPVTEALSHAVLLVDLGGSKTINDSLGRQAGIDLLKNIGSRLQATATEYDAKLSSPMCPMAAYMGGDEFAVLLRECATREDLEQFAAHIKHAMQEPFNLEGRAVHCVFSMGMALARASHVAPEDIVHDAAIALSQAKMNGRGEVAVFEPEMQEEAMARLDLENDIRMAAQRNELEVAYQPKVDLKSGLTYGVEALVRWNHPKRGRLQPGAFIPVAEETGAIVEIGRWILEKACGQVRAWHDILPMQPPLELSVNLSPSEFKQRNLVEEIGQALVATSFPASSLHLELTEGVLFEDMEVARSTLEALKRIGLSLDIDDFGTGYSSLKYLRELPFDCIKIDRYFTGKLDRGEPSSGDLIRTIVEMAQNLGMEVIAEGVETRQQCQMLRELGCKSGQGYYFSKPISADAMQSFLVYQRKVVDIMESSFNPSVVAAATPVLP